MLLRCENCGKDFHVKPWRLGIARFCSRACRYAGMMEPIVARLVRWREVDSNGCWLFSGYVRDDGYATLGIGSRRVFVHRLAFEAWKGPIPEGFQVDHLCRVRRCFNPDHLEAVTQRENSMRGESPTVLLHHANLCINGHEMTEENTAYSKRGWRVCRACGREKQRRYQSRKAEGKRLAPP